ncbi:MAG: hypothetical protein K0S07_1732 [Chlamydiales bacterium]|jgi:hypothetical protein|nr:hypothetical protein [Chlamydiales bacterium]
MRSYHGHLETLRFPSRKKPIYRASAIFPVFETATVSSRILYMGYWMIKRGIPNIAVLVSLRSEEGELLYRSELAADAPKSYRLEVKDLLKSASIATDYFQGSLELEFFASQPLLFPYPAALVNYYGEGGSSFVHTAQRVFNDFDDAKSNLETEVPESGFNIYCDEEKEPFFTLINGPKRVESAFIEMVFFNAQQKTLSQSLHFESFEPYETKVIFPALFANLKEFLGGKAGTAKISFNASWVFPRLIVGNWLKNPSFLNVTHSYYDCSSAKDLSDYWQMENDEWYPAALLVPVEGREEHFTNLTFYPIYSKSRLSIDIEFYNSEGICFATKKNALEIEESPLFQSIELKKLLAELQVTPPPFFTARVIAHLKPGYQLPSRIKVSLDSGRVGRGIPCNICTNLHLANPDLENKPSAFRWLPLLSDQEINRVWLINSAPKKDYRRKANLTLTFYREDLSTFQRTCTILPHSFLLLDLKQDAEIQSFLDGQIGWLTAQSDNPYLTTYYFQENRSGIIGGEHGF